MTALVIDPAFSGPNGWSVWQGADPIAIGTCQLGGIEVEKAVLCAVGLAKKYAEPVTLVYEADHFAGPAYKLGIAVGTWMGVVRAAWGRHPVCVGIHSKTWRKAIFGKAQAKGRTAKKEQSLAKAKELGFETESHDAAESFLLGYYYVNRLLGTTDPSSPIDASKT